MFMKNKKKFLLMVSIISILFIVCMVSVSAEPEVAIPKIGIDVGTATNPQEVSSSVQILLLLTVLTLAPSILIMMTGFTRIIIVLSF
jgi:flagellar biosynthesis protein FliP